MKKRVKRRFLLMFCAMFIPFIITYFTGYSFIVNSNTERNVENVECRNGNIAPFSEFDFNSNNNWEMIILFKGKDIDELPSDVKKANFMKSSNLELLNTIKNEWTFTCLSGDMATTESKVFLKKDGIIVFESGIAVNDNIQGLQSQNFGWAESKDGVLSRSISKFDRSYLPIVFF